MGKTPNDDRRVVLGLVIVLGFPIWATASLLGLVLGILLSTTTHQAMGKCAYTTTGIVGGFLVGMFISWLALKIAEEV